MPKFFFFFCTLNIHPIRTIVLKRKKYFYCRHIYALIIHVTKYKVMEEPKVHCRPKGMTEKKKKETKKTTTGPR